MNRLVLLGMAATLTAGGACSQSREDVQPSPVEWETRGEKDQAMNALLLEDEALKSVAEGQGAIVLVKVVSATVQLPGTRSETVEIVADRVEGIHGDTARTVTLRRYTSKGDRLMEPGRFYVVAGVPNARYGPALQLVGYVACPDGQQAEAVKANRSAVEKLKPAD